MHGTVMGWAAAKVDEHQLQGKSVLEVGSQNVNGSVREYFHSSPYIGVDMAPGDGVDVVARADELPFENDSFEVVVCTEMLEHDPYFWKSLPEMARVLVPGGLLLLTTRGIGYGYHPYPCDYWRFTDDAMNHLFHDFLGFEIVELTADPMDGWFVLGRKPGVQR